MISAMMMSSSGPTASDDILACHGRHEAPHLCFARMPAALAVPKEKTAQTFVGFM
jgi:hypothetical protein